MDGDPRVRQLLEQLLDSERTPEEVCRHCPELLPEVDRRWRRKCACDAELDALFQAPEPRSPSGIPSSTPSSAELPRIPGYEVLEVVGRGGMGVVYRAQHVCLDRPVALKMLLTGAYASPESRERFLREARMGAGLRHPNIVQVHDMGDQDGLPYFTMEFAEGGDLAQRLAGMPQPPRQAAALLATLAEAVQAAHRCGIVHRDLKPANVLFTADGTPKISDFGLARRLEGGAALTLSGVPVGTPSYMAPEQALGRAAAVGPATDVYALGAILYELLTGRPPFRAATGAETVQQVISQEPAPPSRLNAQVPRDLETICLKCLHKEPARRYGSAEELADDLRRFGEGRPIQARRVGWSERTWRWCRRNPTEAALTAALLVPIFMAVGGGLWLGRQSAERRGRAREAIEAVLTQVPGLRRQGRWTEAESILAQGRSRLVEAGSDGLRRRLAQAEKDLRLAAELERIRLTPSIEEHRFDYQGMAKAYAQAFALAGLDVRGDSNTVAARIRSSDLRPQLVMALDHWVYVADGLGDTASMTRLLGLARRADPDPRWGDRFRSPALWRDDEALRRLAAEVQAGLGRNGPENGLPTPLVALLAKKLGQQDGQAEPLLRAAQVRHPEDFWLNYGLGEALRERKPAEAVGFYRAALATRPTVGTVHVEISLALLRQGQANEAILACRRAVELEPKDARFHFYLGHCLHDARRFTEAVAEFRRSIELDPKAGLYHHALGKCLQAMGRADEAMDEFRRSIELEPKDALFHFYLGQCLHDARQFVDAAAEFRRGIELDPSSGVYHHAMSMSLQAMGRVDEAMDESRRSIELDPKSAALHHQLGICWQSRGRLDRAMDEFRRSIELDPKGAASHHQLAACWLLKGRLDEAAAGFRHSIELDPRFAIGYESLAETLLRSGRFTEARTALRQGLDLLPTEEPRVPSLRQKQELCERMIALDARLPALLQGTERPAAAEQVELARLCRDYGRPHAAAGLYAAAFAAQPSLADDLDAGHRYSAARAAARAAADLGPDGARPNERDRASLRRQALGWLRADLALAAKRRRDGKLADLPLADWQTQNDLEGVRARASLAELPAAEREEWRHLWADVDASLAADPLKLGRACAARGDWAQADDYYTRAIKEGVPDDGHFWFEYAALTLLSGDRPDYARACAHMTEACGKHGGPRAYHVARACTLAPDAVADSSLPGRLAEKELRESAREFWSLTERGALAYRQGRYQEAVSFFEQSLQADSKPGRAVVNWIWLALAHQRVGKTEDARRWLDKAKTWLDQFGDGMPSNAEAEFALHFHNWLEAHVLLREAEALMGQATLEGGDTFRAAGTPSK